MKHLFYIHSPITHLVARLIIEHLHLDKGEVVLLMAKNSELADGDSRAVPFPFAEHFFGIPQSRNLLKCFATLKKFDNYIQQVTSGTEYFCYVPQNAIRAIELLVSGKQCRGFSIMEEGTASYQPMRVMNEDYQQRRRSYWDVIGYRNRLGKLQFFRSDYKQVYALTDAAFPGFRDRVQLPTASLKTKAYKNYDGSYFLLYDDILEAEDMRSSGAVGKLNILLKEKGTPKLYYKFHPRHTPQQQEALRLLMREQLELQLEELSSAVSIEPLAINAKDLTFFVNLSSLGLYGAFFGHTVYSFAPWLYNVSFAPHLLYGSTAGYKEFVSKAPPVFKDNIIFLEEKQESELKSSQL